jgi:hypothetical protein
MTTANSSASDLAKAGQNSDDSFTIGDVDSDTETCGTNAAADAGYATSLGDPALQDVTPIIHIDVPIVLVKKSYTPKPPRQPVVLSTDTSFDGTGTFTVTGDDKIHFFTSASGGAEIESGHAFARGGFPVTIYAEGVAPSIAEKDVVLTLSLTGGSKTNKGPATDKMTSVEVTLDICQSRKEYGADPAPVDDKINKGRIVHAQTGDHHGRAMLIIRKAKPENFSGKLVLSAINNKVGVFKEEVKSSSLKDPYEVPNKKIDTTNGVKLWAEGATVSGDLRDTGFKLGVSGVYPEGDRVVMTVVQFSELTAVVPSTEAHTLRNRDLPSFDPNGPVSDHELFQKSGNVVNDYDDDFHKNPPLVLVENSVLGSKPVKLSVRILPPGVPVYWDIQRNPDDSADIVKMSPKPKPTLYPEKVDVDILDKTLMADAVGSFRMRPFVHCNDSSNFEYRGDDEKGKRIDREPFIVMNLVLIRVQGSSNQSRARSNAYFYSYDDALNKVSANMSPPPAHKFKPTSVTGIWVATGLSIDYQDHAAVRNRATVDVVGGGEKGELGLDKLFGGWVNNITQEAITATFGDPTTPAVKTRLTVSRDPMKQSVPSMPFLDTATGLTPEPVGIPVLEQKVLVAPDRRGWKRRPNPEST